MLSKREEISGEYIFVMMEDDDSVLSKKEEDGETNFFIDDELYVRDISTREEADMMERGKAR